MFLQFIFLHDFCSFFPARALRRMNAKSERAVRLTAEQGEWLESMTRAHQLPGVRGCQQEPTAAAPHQNNREQKHENIINDNSGPVGY